MKLKTAKALCIEAHKGQYRRGIPVTWIDHVQENETLWYNLSTKYTTKTGGQLSFDAQLRTWMLREPYSSHPIAVAEMMTTTKEKIVAYLHDVIEDTKWYLDNSISTSKHYICYDKHTAIELPYEVWAALTAITKTKGISYTEYIRTLSYNKLATKVKIADITCNLLDNPSTRQQEKYKKAIKVLLVSL